MTGSIYPVERQISNLQKCKSFKVPQQIGKVSLIFQFSNSMTHIFPPKDRVLHHIQKFHSLKNILKKKPKDEKNVLHLTIQIFVLCS